MTVQYVCAHCGRLTPTPGMVLRGTEKIWLCHADDCHSDKPKKFPFDCYRLVTVYNEEVGERRELGSLLRSAQRDPRMQVTWTEYPGGRIEIGTITLSSLPIPTEAGYDRG